MSTANTVQITHPMLQKFHKQCEDTYNTTITEVDTFLPELQQSAESVAPFQATVRGRGKTLQEATVSPPAQETLELEKAGYLRQYNGYKQTCDKADLLIQYISRTIAGLTTKEYTYANDPNLTTQIARTEEICLQYITDLRQRHNQVTTFKDRLVTTINHQDMQWSLQRFCQIVDNKGLPLSWTARASNCVGSYLGISTIPGSAPTEPSGAAAGEAANPQVAEGQPKAAVTGEAANPQVAEGQPKAAATGEAANPQVEAGQPKAAATGEAANPQVEVGQPKAAATGEAANPQVEVGQPEAAVTGEAANAQVEAGQPEAAAPTAQANAQVTEKQPEAAAPTAQVEAGQPEAAGSKAPGLTPLEVDARPSDLLPAGQGGNVEVFGSQAVEEGSVSGSAESANSQEMQRRGNEAPPPVVMSRTDNSQEMQRRGNEAPPPAAMSHARRRKSKKGTVILRV